MRNGSHLRLAKFSGQPFTGKQIAFAVSIPPATIGRILLA